MLNLKKNTSKTVKINTSSMPDIVFMLLFFFMVATVQKDTDLMVDIKPPSASEVQKLEKKNLVSYIYIGEPSAAYKRQFGSATKIQLNDSYKTIEDIAEFVEAERDARHENEKSLITTSLKVDKNTKMGIVTDVKQELRKANALKINYSTAKAN